MDETDNTADEPAAEGDSQEESQQETEEEGFDEERAKAKIAKVNSEAANLRKRLKELKPLADRAKELEEASKSDQEKLTERASTAEGKLASAELDAARLRVALSKGLTETQAKRLIGENQEELEADADELLASFTTEDEGQEPRRRPRERLRPGAVPTNDEPVEPGLPRLARAYRQ